MAGIRGSHPYEQTDPVAQNEKEYIRNPGKDKVVHLKANRLFSRFSRCEYCNKPSIPEPGGRL